MQDKLIDNEGFSIIIQESNHRSDKSERGLYFSRTGDFVINCGEKVKDFLEAAGFPVPTLGADNLAYDDGALVVFKQGK